MHFSQPDSGPTQEDHSHEVTSTEVTSDAGHPPPGQSETDTDVFMSKNQRKKLARKQRFLDRRPERRRLEREKNRRKRQEAAALRIAQEADGEMPPKACDKPKRKLMSESSNKFRVVIDMDFEGFMTDDEIAKAAKQVGRTYALNRHAEDPCQLYVSSFKGKIRDRFAITCAGYTSWDINVSERDYVDLFVPESLDEVSRTEARSRVQENLIYLTGDTDELLPSVDQLLEDDSKIFVIGGLVDHNRHKNLCYTRARERNIRTAKLPIKENLRLGHRHILSTVTVFEIMLHVLGSHKSWREALMCAIPRRKIHPSEFETCDLSADASNEVLVTSPPPPPPTTTTTTTTKSQEAGTKSPDPQNVDKTTSL